MCDWFGVFWTSSVDFDKVLRLIMRFGRYFVFGPVFEDEPLMETLDGRIRRCTILGGFDEK